MAAQWRFFCLCPGASRRFGSGGALGAAVEVLVSVRCRVASLCRPGCAWRRCGGAPVCALVRRVDLVAAVRVSLLWRCSCLYPRASRRVGGVGARGAAVVVLVSVPWCVASFRRLGCAWRRCGGAFVCTLVRRVVLVAAVRVLLLWWCSCRCPGASRRFGGGGARGASVVVLVSVPWCVASLRRLECAWGRNGGAPVCALVRRVVLVAAVRVSLLWWCSCRCPGASRRFDGWGARGGAVAVLLSVPSCVA